MLNRPWPNSDALAHGPVAPAPDCINPSYGAFDPDSGRHHRRALSPLMVAAIFCAGFLTLTFGLLPAVRLFVAALELLGGAR